MNGNNLNNQTGQVPVNNQTGQVPVNNQSMPAPEPKIVPVAPVIQPELTSTQNASNTILNPIQNTVSTTQKDPNKKSNKWKIIIIVLIILILVGSVYFFFFYDNASLENDNETVNQSENTDVEDTSVEELIKNIYLDNDFQLSFNIKAPTQNLEGTILYDKDTYITNVKVNDDEYFIEFYEGLTYHYEKSSTWEVTNNTNNKFEFKVNHLNYFINENKDEIKLQGSSGILETTITSSELKDMSNSVLDLDENSYPIKITFENNNIISVFVTYTKNSEEFNYEVNFDQISDDISLTVPIKREIVLNQSDDLFYTIENKFTIQGEIAINGYFERGSISVGDKVEIIGYGESMIATVTKLEREREIIETASASNGNVAIYLSGVDIEDIKTGQVVSTVNSLEQYNKIEANFKFISPKYNSKFPPLVSGDDIKIYHTNFEDVVITLKDNTTKLIPNDYTAVSFDIKTKVPMEVGTLCSVYSGTSLIGSIIVTKTIE